MQPIYKRVLLKLSGEVLKQGSECLDAETLAGMARRLGALTKLGVQVGVVLGGGNIFRGLTGAKSGTDRVTGDSMGMLATVINGLAVGNALEAAGVPARVLTATPMPTIAEMFTARKALQYLEAGCVVIIAGGTGNPFFSTDTAAALRAAEIGAEVLLKATKVDGIYTADPKKDPTATRYDTLTYKEALAKQLQVMDAAAFALCMDNRIPIVVFDFFDEAALQNIVCGAKQGTRVAEV